MPDPFDKFGKYILENNGKCSKFDIFPEQVRCGYVNKREERVIGVKNPLAGKSSCMTSSEERERTEDTGSLFASVYIFAIPNRRISTWPERRRFSKYRPAVFRLISTDSTRSVMLRPSGCFSSTSLIRAVISLLSTMNNYHSDSEDIMIAISCRVFRRQEKQLQGKFPGWSAGTDLPGGSARYPDAFFHDGKTEGSPFRAGPVLDKPGPADPGGIGLLKPDNDFREVF